MIVEPRLSALKKGLVALATCAAFSGSHASLLGNNATCAIEPNFWACVSDTATVVDPGIEFLLSLGGGNGFILDFDANSLTINRNVLGYALGSEGLLTIGGLTGATGIAGFSSINEIEFDLSDVSFADGTLTINLDGYWYEGGSATITFTTSNDVPEPATLALVGAAVLAGALTRRRRRI